MFQAPQHASLAIVRLQFTTVCILLHSCVEMQLLGTFYLLVQTIQQLPLQEQIVSHLQNE